ncbi:site-specific tyrosine recombinase XerD [compost metagenome]
MTPPGRPRKAPPNLPAHIDYSLVPPGIYWDRTGRGRWYIRVPHEEGHGSRTKTVAGPTARMSDLHAIMEARRGEAQRGTVAFVIDRHAESLAFAQLKPSTQVGYKDYAKAIKAYPLKNGTPLSEATVDRLTPGFIRRLIDVIAQGRPGLNPGNPAIPGYPTKANHWLRYLRRVFGWAREHDHVTTNPAADIKQVKEKSDHRMPAVDLFRRVQAYAKQCSARGPRAKGAVPAYLWAAMELAYQARLRGIEVLTLTDAHVDGEVLRTNRRKGSRDNLVRKGAETEQAIAMLRARRATIWEKNGGVIPIRAENRYLFVSEDGERLTEDGWQTAWGRMRRNAVKDGILSQDERFGLHSLKHRGVTDTKGDKKEASGHKTDAMMHVYDHSMPTVAASDDPT